MASHRSNLIRLGIIAGLFLAVIVAGLVGSVKNGNYIVISIVFTAIAIAVLVMMFGHYRVRVMLRDRTPDRIIQHYHRSVRRIPHADAAAAYLAALAAAFFGQFDRARAELELVNWDAATPVYRGHRLYVLALLATLEETNYTKALQLAAQARELESREPSGGLQALDDVIHLVAGEPDPEVIARLEKVAKRQHGMMPGMCAWALAVHYKRSGQPEKASDYKDLLRMSVPHSAPLRAAAAESPSREIGEA
ncbi:MAG: hypothetical protein KGN84_11380 [Acidobacteriota bacterium]|nr:hypothetical protein [Acidobacteriota bacterium]